MHTSKTPINRYSIVTTGKRLTKNEVKAIADAMAELNAVGLGKCVSLGIIDSEDMMLLKSAWVNRYHHNWDSR